MKNKTRFDLMFASLTAASLCLFMSCGHQRSKTDDGLFADIERERGIESSEVNVAADSSEKSSDISKDLTEDLAGTTSKEAPTEAKAPEETKNIDPTQLGDGGSTPPTTLAGASQLDAAPPTAEELPPMDSAAMKAPESQTKAPELAQMTVPPVENNGLAPLPAGDALPNFDAPAPAPEVKPAAKAKSVKAPTIPKESQWKKGHTLNRFYFLRHEDTPQKVAELIYGTSDRANDLTAWNKDWKTGKIILFESAVAPNDTEMRSLFEERGIQSEAYTVQKGEALRDVAQASYGDKLSWAEIAAFNNLSDTKVEEGTVLNLFPSKLPQAEKVAENKAPEAAKAEVAAKEAEKPAEEEVMPEEKAEKIEASVTSQEPVAQHKVGRADKAMQADLANPQVGGFLDDHVAALIGGALILLASFFAFRYFRRSRELQD